MADESSGTRLWTRALVWLVVLVPATWGVVQVARKAEALFR